MATGVLLVAALALSVVTVTTAILAREPCTAANGVAMMIYASGFSPTSPTSAKCGRCISSFALSRFHQTSRNTQFAFEAGAADSCQAMYVSAVTGMRAICESCDKEVASIRSAFEPGGNSCSDPMMAALSSAESHCKMIALNASASTSSLIRTICVNTIPVVLGIFNPVNGTSLCSKELTRMKRESEVCTRCAIFELCSASFRGQFPVLPLV
jgi:hypothetical protein